MPFQPLSPMSSVGESSAASLPPDSSELPGSQLQRGQDQADVTPGCITPPGCFTSPNLHYRELEKVAAMEQQAKACQDKACQDRVCQDRACQDTPPELLQLILVCIQNCDGNLVGSHMISQPVWPSHVLGC